MDRNPPRALSDEIDLYIRTYYSLLRSSGEVAVRAFEEAHAYSNSSLHAGARDESPDVAAFAYSAARLPDCMPQIEFVVLGQSHEQFEAAGVDARAWQRVRARGRRRPLRWDGRETLAAFVTSTSDIDDLIPILTAYQIEWNKIHEFLTQSQLGRNLAASMNPIDVEVDLAELGTIVDLDPQDIRTLCAALGPSWKWGLAEMAKRPSDRSVRLLSGSFAQYQRASQRWWSEIESAYVTQVESTTPPAASKTLRRPVYFVSSNTHAFSNLTGGYARAHRDEIVAFAQRRNPENLATFLNDAQMLQRDDDVSSLTYYLLRAFLHEQEGGVDERIESVQRFDAESGIRTIESPGKVDVSAQIIELGKLMPERLDPRICIAGIDKLRASDAIILNIDYPLGMAAYHHLSRLVQGVGEIRGIYVMGKAATLNGRVGDVMISTVVHDEHSLNTYLYRNCFTAGDVQPFLQSGSVFDNQKALTVRGAFLQNREYMSVFYKDGYTVLEMEAGPYLSAIYELVNPNRHPDDEIVHLSNLTPFDIGILHYASDTPYSRRQSLLSKSLSYFGVDSTYACAIAIAQRIFQREITRLSGRLPTSAPAL